MTDSRRYPGRLVPRNPPQPVEPTETEWHRRALAAEERVRELEHDLALAWRTAAHEPDDTLLSMLHRATRELDAAGATKPAAAIREELAAMGGSDGE